MPYSDFTLEKACKELPLKIMNADLVFNVTENYCLPAEFMTYLKEGIQLGTAIDNEKSRSEFIVAPLLLRLKSVLKNEISIFSGTELNIDKQKGLTGVCDFLIAKSKMQYILTQPIIALVEAKNSDIYIGLGQCIAEMYAAQLYNQQQNSEIKITYGIVTTGTAWKFLTLQEDLVIIDNNEYFINDVEKLFSILIHIIQQS